MDYSQPWALYARNIGQRIGVLRPIVRAYRKILNIDYEQSFDNAVHGAIRSGDTIWDVGANIGHYSLSFCERAGPKGQVIAIEPSPSSLDDLRSCTEQAPNIHIENIALSNQEGTASFFLNSGDNNTVDGLSRASANQDAEEISVDVHLGDKLAEKYMPNIVKIDVEGFELEVLLGMQKTLLNSALHTVAIEVHFLTLAQRDNQTAPAEITKLLKASGFKTHWTDPSHVIAQR